MWVVSGPTSAGRNLRIGELSRRSGVSVELLRAWERRYALLSPARTAGGYRLYDEGDLDLVRRMLAHQDAGLSAAEAARLTREEATGGMAAALPAGRSDTGPEPPQRLGQQLQEALEELNETRAQRILDSLLSRYALQTVLREGVLPCLRRLGDRWESGEVSVGQEHFASSLIRSRLLSIARGWGSGTGPRALLACMPGEQHDIGLICFGLALRGHGWSVIFLGQDTPLETVRETALGLSPALVVLTAILPVAPRWQTKELSRLAGVAPLALGGTGFGGGLAARIGARRLQGDPLAAAEQIQQLGFAGPAIGHRHGYGY